VSPEASTFFDKARKFLAKAEDMLADGWPDEAARAAYLAGLHAAQAVIVERTGRVIRRHRGVRNELWRLLKGDPRFDAELRGFLGRAYNLKSIADYETGPEAGSRSSLPARQSRRRAGMSRLSLDCWHNRTGSDMAVPQAGHSDTAAIRQHSRAR
jgi:uncharacterized protein (UPF0332 family)